MRSVLFIVSLVVLLVAHSNAFTSPLTSSRVGASASVSTTAIGFFGLFDKKEEEPAAAPKGKKKNVKNTKVVVEEKKKPNPFVPGKGKYDWVKNSKVSAKESTAFSWSTKPRTTED